MYNATLVLHSYLRWVVLIFAVIAVLRAIAGWQGRGLWTPADDRAGRFFTIAFDIQVLVGLILYVAVSPITAAAMQDFGGAMRNAALRYFAVEHLLGMIVALAIAHMGRAKARRKTDHTARHRTTAIYFGLSLLLMLASIPWPFMAAARPLFRVPVG